MTGSRGDGIHDYRHPGRGAHRCRRYGRQCGRQGFSFIPVQQGACQTDRAGERGMETLKAGGDLKVKIEKL